MMSLANDIQELREICQRRDNGYAMQFEVVLSRIAELHDAHSITALAEFLDDEAEFDELMFSIIHTIENFDDVVYIRELLQATPELILRAPRWASILFMRVLNSENTRLELIKALSNATWEQKESIRNLMKSINKRSDRFTDQITLVLDAFS